MHGSFTLLSVGFVLDVASPGAALDVDENVSCNRIRQIYFDSLREEINSPPTEREEEHLRVTSLN